MGNQVTQKMEGKDFITCGIFSLLGMVGMIVSAVMNVSGYTAAFYPAVASFFIGLLFAVVAVKVPKRGALIVFSIVPCAYFFASGFIEGIVGSLGILLCAVIGEAILAKDRTSMKRITLAGLAYTLYMSVVGMAENFIATDHYCDAALAHGINPAVVEGMRQMYAIKPLWVIVVIATAALTLLGVQLGKMIMAKHLKKAGIV